FGARCVKAKADHRLVVLKGRLGIDQGIATDHYALAHNIGGGAGARSPPLLRGQNLVTWWEPAAARVLHRNGGVHELKGQLSGPAEQGFDMLGVVDAGELDENTVGAFALNCRFLGSGLVDPPTNDLDRLVDRLPTPRLGRNVAKDHPSRPLLGASNY